MNGYEEHLRDQPDTIADLDRGEGTFYDNTHPEDDYGWEHRHYYYHDWKDMKFENFTPVTKPKAVYVEEEDCPF